MRRRNRRQEDESNARAEKINEVTSKRDREQFKVKERRKDIIKNQKVGLTIETNTRGIERNYGTKSRNTEREKTVPNKQNE
ncbi:hypothetical protein ALC53_02901 [Atta colombica]|uniref:Uncharacterized protein n=1 Tax=Atta colombica TaxID=520822 RepID=A0A195BQK6_9HYME|nr:hypothetical protein ALC53_02901 [Atta colombica]